METQDQATVDMEKLIEHAARLADDHRRFMRQLVAARHEAGLSQEQVAERMAVSQPAVSKFERYDSNPTLDTLRRYALAVGVELRTSVLKPGDDDWKGLRSAQVCFPNRTQATIGNPWVKTGANRKLAAIA